MLPPLAIRTHFSTWEGSAGPGAWGEVLAPAGGADWRVLLADRDDLRALPAVLRAWGPGHVAVGATLGLGTGADGDALVAAPDAVGYRQLCQLLSWHHEQPLAFRAWLAGDRDLPLDLSALTVLLRDEAAAERVRAGGAQAWWHAQDADEPGRADLEPLWLPVVVHRDERDLAGETVRRALGRPGATTGGPTLRALLAAPPTSGPAVERGRALLARCTYVPDGTLHLPPSRHADATGELRLRAEAGARRRYGRIEAPVRARLERELVVIAAKGFCGYLLTVADLAAGRRTCGRGSGASSLVVYCLGLTNVDPVRYQLLFERFLNPARTDPPDLDIDFPWDERDAVLAEALRVYGRAHVAMVATHQHLHGRGALRAVARAHGRDRAATTAVRAQLTGRSRYGAAVQLDADWAELIVSAEALVGTPHHVGLHCGGVIITPGPIRDLVPVHPAAKHIVVEGGRSEPVPAIAWEKDGAEALGLVKIDLLGNRSLAVVRDALADLAEDGITIDEARWRPADDPATRRLVASGATMGCFYIESPAMRQLQAKAGTGEFDALVVHSSIIRPAASRWIADYLERLHHVRATKQHDPAWYPHPALRTLLSESFGILSYQEDVMMAAIELAGFDDREANALRKVLGQWDTGTRLTQFAERFRAGAQARGVTDAVIAQVWGNIASFAGYSFCKAHSASYAMLSFQCAYLKAHHPAYFLARVIANEGGFYGPANYLEEARRLGLTFRGPCVVGSRWLTVRDSPTAIRCGLHLVPGLPRGTAERLLRERERAPFNGVADLRRRSGLTATLLLTLARAGALDALRPGLDRHRLAWLATAVGRDIPVMRVEDDDGVMQRTVPLAPDEDPAVPDLPVPTARQAAWVRWRTLGFLPEGHPLWFCDLPARRLRCRDVTAALAGSRVVIFAWPITRKQVEAKAAHRPGEAPPPPAAMAFVTLEDETGLIETVWFPAVYRACGPLLERNGPLRLEGLVETDWGVATLTVLRAEPVDPHG